MTGHRGSGPGMRTIRSSPANDTWSEDDLVDGVLGAAGFGGWEVYHTRRSDLGQLQGWSSLGFPDLVLVRDRVIWVEAKTARGVLSMDQHRWNVALTRADQDVRIVRPDQYDALVRELLGDRLARDL